MTSMRIKSQQVQDKVYLVALADKSSLLPSDTLVELETAAAVVRGPRRAGRLLRDPNMP